jgi:hypothetical protein
MSRFCDHFACTKDLLDWFLWAAEQENPDHALVAVTNHLYRDPRVLCHEGKPAWEGVHRALTDDDSFGVSLDRGEYPLRLCIHGGRPLWRGIRTVALVEASQVPDLVAALRSIDRAWVLGRFLAMQRRRAPAFDRWDMHDYSAEVWREIESLLAFFLKAAQARLPVVCTTSP